MERIIEFPKPAEYPAYTEMYMKLLRKDGSLLRQLHENYIYVRDLFLELNEEQLKFKYAPEKWSLKEVLVHIIDDERVYAYRALAFARNDKTSLPGFDENLYTQHADVAGRTLDSILKEYRSVRESTIALFEGFSEKALLRKGTADGKQNSVRSLGYHIAGHELHHLKIIKERYLNI